MLSDPVGERFLRGAPIGECQNLANYFGIARHKIMAIQAQEGGHGQKADALVAVSVRMVLHETERIRGGQHRQIRAIRVMPLLLGSRQGGFEDVLVTNPWQASMFSDLVVVDSIDDRPAEPLRLVSAFGHRLLRELSKCVAILLGGFRGDFQGAFGLRVVGCQENSAIGFHRQYPVAGLQPQAVGHVLGQGGTDRTAGLAESDFLGHGRSVAY
jgi:hypothetical protein